MDKLIITAAICCAEVTKDQNPAVERGRENEKERGQQLSTIDQQLLGN